MTNINEIYYLIKNIDNFYFFYYERFQAEEYAE